MKKNAASQIITILVTVATITVNVLANALPINGQDTGEISDRFEIFFVPAGYVFSIWGLIYIGLIAFTVYQALPAQRDNPLIKKIAPAFWVGNLANIVWIFLWHYNIFSLTLIAMLTLLGSLLYIYWQVSRAGLEGTGKWFLKLPFSLYLGWISVATIANVSQVLFYAGWDGFGISGAVWAVIMSLIAAVLGLLMTIRESDIAYVLVLVWAFIGIGVAQADTALVANTAYVIAALLAVGLVAIPLIFKRKTT